MNGTSSPMRGVADTARWVALYRALETERPDAVFRDPYARRLAGKRGEEIMASVPPSARKAAWAFVARTYNFDHFIQEQVRGGVTLVINLAAGLDSRPYRLSLPRTLRWVEVDQPELLAEKTAAMSGVEPECELERIAVDLADESQRRELLRRLDAEGRNALVVTEGLLVYLSEAQVGGLAADLAACSTIRSWVTDLMSPALMRIVQKDWGRTLREAGAPLQFAPEAGPAFFAPVRLAGRGGPRRDHHRGSIETPSASAAYPLEAAGERHLSPAPALVGRLPAHSSRRNRSPACGACRPARSLVARALRHARGDQTNASPHPERPGHRPHPGDAHRTQEPPQGPRPHPRRRRLRGLPHRLERHDRPAPGAGGPVPRHRRRDRVRPVRPRPRPPALHQGRGPQHRGPRHRRRRPHARPLPHARRLGRPAHPGGACAGRLPPGRRGPRDPAARARRRARIRLGDRHHGTHPGRRIRLPDQAVGLDLGHRARDGPRDRRRPAGAGERRRAPRSLLGTARRGREFRRRDRHRLRPASCRPRGGRRPGGLAGQRGAQGCSSCIARSPPARRPN